MSISGERASNRRTTITNFDSAGTGEGENADGDSARKLSIQFWEVSDGR